MIDTKTKTVLFAEASKDFIDFLFNLLQLPIGSVIRLLTKNEMVGCLGKLYESIENLNETYLLNPTQHKEVLLKPNALVSGFLQLPSNESTSCGDKSGPLKLYMCSNRCSYNVTDVMFTKCRFCRVSMCMEVTYVGQKASGVTQSGSGGGEGGFVKGVVTYMVMDDLVVQPMSTISSISLLNKFNVKEVGALQEKVVQMGMKGGIKLLKTSLLTNNVLTSVFLKNIMARGGGKRRKRK
ncbi:DUF674 family protein [Senna tora]|uniref:DUF674 family protein n=1 Tax=Senna tora TaxID=362788 RepID=A0A834T7L6_9FABA|nr:DUF674 family protein [Senna tora]